MLIDPDNGFSYRFLELLYQEVIPVCRDFCGVCLEVFAMEMSCYATGFFPLYQIYGMQGATDLIIENPLFVNALPLIGGSLFLLSYLPWQDNLLQMLRRLSRLPLLRAVLPEDLPIIVYKYPTVKTKLRVLGDALLMPVIAKVVGTVFSGAVESPLLRFLVGGAVYLTTKCSLYMYLKQRLLRHQHQIEVLPIKEPTE